jgi:hypothetical protein
MDRNTVVPVPICSVHVVLDVSLPFAASSVEISQETAALCSPLGLLLSSRGGPVRPASVMCTMSELALRVQPDVCP